MTYSILFILLIALSSGQDDSQYTSPPIQVELEEQIGKENPEENSGIFQVREFKKGMGPMDQFFLKDLFETITAAFDDFADNAENSTFLSDNASLDEMDESAVQIKSPLLGFFNPLFSIFTTEGDSDFVEIETIQINGQTQTKVTKSSTRNGFTTTTTEITTEPSVSEVNQEQNKKLSEEFQLFENPQIISQLNQTDQYENNDEISDENDDEQINKVNLDNLDSYQELPVIQDNYVKNDQQINVESQSDTNTKIGITILCGLSLAAIIGFSIKKCSWKNK